jgi:hypothetical protein
MKAKIPMGLMASKYFFPLLKLMETTCGAPLVSGSFVPRYSVVIKPLFKRN